MAKYRLHIFLLVFLPGLFLVLNDLPGNTESALCKQAQSTQGLTLSDNVEILGKKSDLAQGVSYFKMRWKELVAHVVLVDMKSKNWKISPAVSDKLVPTSHLAQKCGAIAAINAGYFNMSDGVSASYIVENGKLVCDPTENKALIKNENLKPFLKQIFDRRELRLYEDKAGRQIARVEKHNEPTPEEFKLINSMQAGPQLLPELTSREGAFVRVVKGGKSVDSIGTRYKAARSAVGITESGDILFVLVEGHRKKEFSTGTSLAALAQFMKELGCVSALNLDGGTSSTIVVKGEPEIFGVKPTVAGQRGYTVLFSNEPERRIKSALVVVPASN